MKPRLLRFLLLLPIAVSAATRVEVSGDRAIPALAFSATEIERAAALAPAGAPLAVSLEIDPAADVQMAREWKPGAIVETQIKRSGTEAGFKK